MTRSGMARFLAAGLVLFGVGCKGDEPATDDSPGGGGVPSDVCGNGVVDGAEECEQLDGCSATERCTDTCTCEAKPATPPDSQGLIAAALRAGTIDYATSLEYRVWALFQAPELPEAYDGEGNSGEDATLFLELSRVRGLLPQEIEDAVSPYLVRPNDPASIYSMPPALRAAAAAAAPGPVGCDLNREGSPDWRSYETTNFVVWSCGGGVAGTDPDAASRPIVGTLVEQVRSAMATTLGVITPDDQIAGPTRTDRTDIYIIRPNVCRMRGGSCSPITGNALALAAPATPCKAGVGGALTSSAYLVVAAAAVPAVAPGPTTPSELRYILAHEMFHGISYGFNLQAQGGVCVPEVSFPTGAEDSWLTEASADWASYVFFERDWPQRRTGLFRLFQKVRDLSREGLQATDPADENSLLTYEAWLYPMFVQEESAKRPDVMINFWKNSGPARKPADLDDRLNGAFSFADHFRDFSVRNLNMELPGDPILALHKGYDYALPTGAEFEPDVPKPTLILFAPQDLKRDLNIAPLSSQYERYSVEEHTRSVRIDLSDVPNMAHLSMDVIYKVHGAWKRNRVNGPVYEFCRDDEGDDIDEFFLVLANDDRTRPGRVDGNYKVTTRLFCPGGWSGSFKFIRTLDEFSVYEGVDVTETTSRHEREVQTWTVASTTLVLPPGAPQGYEVEQLNTVWNGSLSVDNSVVSVDRNCGTSTSTETGSGDGSATTPFQVFPVGGGSYTLTPTGQSSEFDIPVIYAFDKCNEPPGSSSTMRNVPEGLAYLISTPGVTLLSAKPDDPGHFTGSANVLHAELPLEGGQSVQDLTVTWDLRREARR